MGYDPDAGAAVPVSTAIIGTYKTWEAATMAAKLRELTAPHLPPCVVAHTNVGYQLLVQTETTG